MQHIGFGKTGWQVSVAALGCGGPSRIGQAYGASTADSQRLVIQALEAGINLVDTACAYGTEEIVGNAVNAFGRDRVYLSTKVKPQDGDSLLAPEKLEQRVGAALKRLNTDYVDVLHLHGVMLNEYDYVRDELLPVLQKLKKKGAIRAAGVTEMFGTDTTHRMLCRAVVEDDWDAVMVGFNILNQSARHTILPHTRRREIGVLVMFAVRRALSRPDRLREVISELIARDAIDTDKLNVDQPLGFLIDNGAARAVTDAAYRFCRHEPGCDVIITGTGDRDHLRENIDSLQAPPLRDVDHARLIELFGGSSAVSGN